MSQLNRHKDFDAAWEEEVQPLPLSFKAMGEEYSLPASIPALLVVGVMRAKRTHKNRALPPAVIAEMAEILFGPEQFARLMARKEDGSQLSSSQLAEIFLWALAEYGYGPDGEEQGDPKEGQAGG
jgi:hypothetical protein